MTHELHEAGLGRCSNDISPDAYTALSSDADPRSRWVDESLRDSVRGQRIVPSKSITLSETPSVGDESSNHGTIANVRCADIAPDVLGHHTRTAKNRSECLDDRKRRRRPFYAADKKRACELYVANPGITHQQLADALNVHRTAITRVLRRKNRWLESEHPDKYQFARDSGPIYLFVEMRLYQWLKGQLLCNAPVSDNMIKQQALFFANQLGYRGEQSAYFRCGRTWLRNFKARYEVANGKMTGRGLTALDKIRSKAFGHYDVHATDPRNLPVDNIIALMQSVGEDNDSYVASDNTHVTYTVSSARDESPPRKDLGVL